MTYSSATGVEREPAGAGRQPSAPVTTAGWTEAAQRTRRWARAPRRRRARGGAGTNVEPGHVDPHARGTRPPARRAAGSGRPPRRRRRSRPRRVSANTSRARSPRITLKPHWVSMIPGATARVRSPVERRARAPVRRLCRSYGHRARRAAREPIARSAPLSRRRHRVDEGGEVGRAVGVHEPDHARPSVRRRPPGRRHPCPGVRSARRALASPGSRSWRATLGGRVGAGVVDDDDVDRRRRPPWQRARRRAGHAASPGVGAPR